MGFVLGSICSTLVVGVLFAWEQEELRAEMNNYKEAYVHVYDELTAMRIQLRRAEKLLDEKL